MILRHGHGLLARPDHNCFVHIDDANHNRPVLMVGRLHRQDAAGRATPPPDCVSGFDTAGTPFAKGHIMAVELGGWDDSNNIVPQYEKWQALPNGAWRAMEIAIFQDGSKNSMIVRMTYANVVDNHAALRLQFQGGDTLSHWQDPRIPVRFEVWALAGNDPGGYFGLDDAGKLAGAGALLGALGPPGYDFQINAMPDIDRRFWKITAVRGIVGRKYAEYTADHEAAIQRDIDTAWLRQTMPRTGGTMKAKHRGVAGGRFRPQRPKPRKTKRQITAEVQDRHGTAMGRWDWLQSGTVADDLADEIRNHGAHAHWTATEAAHLAGWTHAELHALQGAHLANMIF